MKGKRDRQRPSRPLPTTRKRSTVPRAHGSTWLRAVGARFRALREASGFDQHELPSGAPMVSRFENGRGLHLTMLEAWCRAIEVHPAEVFQGTGPAATDTELARGATRTVQGSRAPRPTPGVEPALARRAAALAGAEVPAMTDGRFLNIGDTGLDLTERERREIAQRATQWALEAIARRKGAHHQGSG